MACGKPVVASPVGVNEKIVRESNAGYLALNKNDWTQALSELCQSEDLRIKYGYEAREYIEKYYSMQIMLPTFANAINTLE